MIATKIEKSRKSRNKGLGLRDLGTLIAQVNPDYTDLSDSLLLIMHRLDDLRFTVNEDWSEQKLSPGSAGELQKLITTQDQFQHIEKEIEATLVELLWLLDSFSTEKLWLKLAKHDVMIRQGVATRTSATHRLPKEAKKVKRFTE